jgi:HSP20 family protein
MAATDITKTPPKASARQPDIFGAMRDEMDRVLERFENGWPHLPGLFSRSNDRDWMVPQLDIHDNGKQLAIEVDLPGVEEKDVTVSLANGMLTIKGEKRSEHAETQENCYVAERAYGTFERTLRLPDTIDDAKLEARFDKGVLKILAHKKPEAMKAERKIEIKKT